MSSTESQIADEIFAYLAEHPDAQDTVEGITEWWLSERTGRVGAAKVRLALDTLVAQGLVLERRDKRGCSYFKINRARLKEVQH